MTTCTGACCAAFVISGGMDNFKRLLDGRTNEYRGDHMVRLKDILEPISSDEARDRLTRFGGSLKDFDPAQQMFKCTKWDETTRRCTVYEQRPAMCHDYPSKACDHGCSTKGKRYDTPAVLRRIAAQWTVDLSAFVDLPFVVVEERHWLDVPWEARAWPLRKELSVVEGELKLLKVLE